MVFEDDTWPLKSFCELEDKKDNLPPANHSVKMILYQPINNNVYY